MLLPQTDIALPGSLPLVFERVFDSSYRGGRWFGHGWSSTVDQRLEIDAEGVVFSCNEGSLLAYPHPAPGAPVMPTHGRRWPLDRVDGGYTITDPEAGCVRHFVDHPAGELALLAQIDDRNGCWISFEYDDLGTPTSIVHHGGYRLKLTTHDGRVTALHLAGAAPDGSDQEILRYGYTEGHLTEVTNSSGTPLRFDYDELGRITAWTDTNGSRYEYSYDEHDRCVYQTGANGHLEAHFAWDDIDPATGLRMTSTTDGLGNTTRYVINARSQVVAEINALGVVTRYEYDRYHRLLSVTDPLGHTTRSSYDEQGRLTSVSRPDGRELTAEYNTLGLPVRVKSADGTVIRQTYDERGNRTSITDASDATTTYAYDGAGRITSVTDALGHRTSVRCDAAGLLAEITDPLGATTRYERDAYGRPVAITDALRTVTWFAWTPEGNLAHRVDPDGSRQSWTYDGEGNCLSHTDSMGGVTTFEYSDFDLLVARTGPDSARHEFGHDSLLRLTEVTSPQGLRWSYTYDAVGRLVRERDFDGRTLVYTYDAASRLVSRTNGAGQIIRFERNELGQLLRKYVDGTLTRYEYDDFDQLAVASGPDVTLTRIRDRHGRLKFEGVNGRCLTFKHDALGRRISRTTPGGVVSAWTYDAAGRRNELTTSGRKLTFDRDAAGQELVRHIGKTVTSRHEFDIMGRLTEQRITASGRTVQRRAYAYRADGNVVGIDDRMRGAQKFDVDAVGRVTAVRAPDWEEQYAYDSAGNQIKAAWPSEHPGQEAMGARTYTGTRIDAAGGVRYEHDAQGRVILRQKRRLSRKPETWRYEWDAEDRLVAVLTPDGVKWRYLYDPLGRRVAKQRLASDGSSIHEQTSFTWDDGNLCEQRASGRGLPNPVLITWDHEGVRPLTQSERVIHGGPSQEVINERFFSVVTDLIGTPSELIDESGEIAWRARTTLWGKTSWSVSSAAYTPLRFPGQYFDPESGLHYNVHRYYDPEIARYVTVDPLGLRPAPNTVSYVTSPHTWADPLGLKPCKVRVSPVAPDWATKGAHVHIPLKKKPGLEDEVRIFVDDSGKIAGEPIRLEHGWASEKSVREAVDAVNNDPKLRADLLAKATSAREHMLDHNWGNNKNRAGEMTNLIEKLEGWP
ncbi:DUF6531 domain-containing protein [Streptomyces sp. NBC_00727]